MSSFIFPQCPHCGHKNAFDLEELRKESATVFRAVPQEEEFQVMCTRCGRPFVFKVRENADDRA